MAKKTKPARKIAKKESTKGSPTTVVRVWPGTLDSADRVISDWVARANKMGHPTVSPEGWPTKFALLVLIAREALRPEK